MYFELQLSASVFTKIVRNRLKSIPLCIDREVSDTDGTRLVVDRVVIADSTWLQREQTIELVDNLPDSNDAATQLVWIFSPTNYTSITVPFLQVKQEVTIHLVKSSDLDANGANPTAPFKTLTIYPVFNVALHASNATQGGGPVTLSYTLAHVDFGLLYLALSATQRAEIQQLIANVNLPPTTIDFSALTALLKRPVAAINAGIACDPSGTFVALRVDFDVYASSAAVDRAFFEAGPTGVLAGKEWAMLIDANVLTQDAKAKASAALAGASKVKLVEGPHVSWDPSGPAIDISAEVELVDACPFFIDDIDMDADVDIRIAFSVPTPNTLRTRYHLTGEPTDVGEEIACALTGALLWPFIGPLFLKDESIGTGIGAYLGGLAAGPVVTFFGIIAAIESKGLTKDISKSLGSTCAKLDDENYECNDIATLVMSLSPSSNSRLEVESAFGVAAGLVVSGTISNLRDPLPGSLEPIHVKPFSWEVLGACRGNRKNNFTIGNQAKITVSATPPAGMCKAYLLADPLGEFALTVDDDEVIITPRYEPAYVASPYPCRVRIITNRGVRTITLAPPAAITPEEVQALETARLRAVASCFYWERHFTNIEKLGWLIDPPFGDREAVHFWQIVVRGLLREESLRVEGLERMPLMTARPTEAGVAHLSFMFPAAEAPVQLSLELLGERRMESHSLLGERREGTESSRPIEVSMHQALFELETKLRVHGPLRAMRFEGSGRARRLLVEDAEQVMVWDVRAPHAPQLLRATKSTLNPTGSDGTGHVGVVVQNGKRIGAIPSTNLRRALERLRERLGPPEAVGNPRVGGFAETLYVRTRRGAAMYDISSADEPREVQVFERPAWIEGVALGGRLMARHDPVSDVVELYSASVREKI